MSTMTTDRNSTIERASGQRDVAAWMHNDYRCLTRQAARLTAVETRLKAVRKAMKKESNPVERRYLDVLRQQLESELVELPSVLRSINNLREFADEVNRGRPVEQRIVLA